MPTLTLPAADVFNPLTAGGAPRGADMAEVRTWGTEIEGILLAPDRPLFGTRAAAIAATIDASVDVVTLMGHTTAVDGGGGDYRRLASDPGHAASFQSADGAWWQLIPRDGRWSILQIGGGAARNAPLVNATTYMNQMQAVCVAMGGAREVHWPMGSYYFTTQPAEFSYGIRIIGNGRSFTVFRRQYDPASAFAPFLSWNGQNERAGALMGVALNAHLGSTGVALRLRAFGPGLKPDSFEIDDVQISSFDGSTWTTGNLIDGSLSLEAPGISKGVRNLIAKNFFIFNCTANAVNMNVAVNVMFFRLWTGGSGGNVTVTGTTDPRTDTSGSSTDVRFDGCDIGGTISWQNTQIFNFFGDSSGQTITASAINGHLAGVLGNISNSSDTVKVDDQRTYKTATLAGHISHPNQLLENWGRASMSAATLAVTFDKAFTAAPHNIVATPMADFRVWVTAITTTGFTLNQSGTGALSVNWRAIGPG